MPLFHFSEDPTITRFVPRSPLARPEVEPLVWAIDAWHAPLYYVPRDCPRVGFWLEEATTTSDQHAFFGHVCARMVIVIEAAWFDRFRSTRMYRYHVPEELFEPFESSGRNIFVSRHAVVPLAKDILDDLPVHMLNDDIELRVSPSLVSLGKAVAASTLGFSMIRMRNAKGWNEPSR
jgi:hypothetical protein